MMESKCEEKYIKGENEIGIKDALKYIWMSNLIDLLLD